MADYKKDEKEKVAPWVEDINELVTRRQWKRLLTATFVLKLLSECNSYGNRLEKDIFDRTHNTYKPNPNELYPVLRLLEDKGFVKSQWDSPDKRSRRIYTITTRGRQAIPYMIEQVLGWLNDFDALISTVREEFAD